MISINQLSVHFTGTYIFDNVSFIIRDRDRIGLVGRNGAGKTTLLRIIAGLLEPEKGTIAKPSGSSIGYLPQEIEISSALTVWDEAVKAFSEVLEIKKEMELCLELIEDGNSNEETDFTHLSTRLETATDRFQILGGYTMEADTERVLAGLGFNKEDFRRPLSEFSGGWQMRVELAKILLAKPDLILLDEPTNHLDIVSIQWLEDYLAGYSGAVLLVSHDRAFLDNVTNRTVEISLGSIYDYNACYSDYTVMRLERMEQQLATYTNQQRQIEQIERFVNRFRYKSTKARQVQSRLKMLDKMDKVEIDEVDTSSIRFVFPEAPSSGKIALELNSVSKYYEKQLIFNDVSFILARGDRIAFAGRNGEGKTTLSKIIVGDLSFDGNLQLGHNITIGYYAQNQADLLNGDLTVFETLDHVATGEMRPKIRGLLGSFLFGNDAIDKKVKVLSGGEKSRLALARMLLKPINLLVLDEPTNHLDMQSKDILKNALLKYSGTLIIVSHDRDFLQGLTTKVFEFRDKAVKQYIGDIYDFLDSRRLDSLKDLDAFGKKSGISAGSGGISENKTSFEKKKEIEKDIRKANNRISNCEKEIEQLEKELRSIDHSLANPDLFPETVNDPDTYPKYKALQKKLENKLSEWAELHDKAEELKKLIIS